MKSTYNILSKHLDQKLQSDSIPVSSHASNKDFIFNYDESSNLFDYPHCKRFINGSELISQDLESISLKLRQLSNLEELIIRIDYISPLSTLNRLVIKRILQAVNLLQKIHPNILFKIFTDNNSIGQNNNEP